VETLNARLDRLKSRLDTLVAAKPQYSALATHPAAIDVVITNNEINDLHGTGPLVKRILRGRTNLLSIRFYDDWGRHDLGDWDIRLPRTGLDRAESYRKVIGLLAGCRVHSVLCVPYGIDDLMSAIAIHDIFGGGISWAGLAGYVMDDQNIAVDRVPDSVMREFMERCSLRLATHPELRIAYERKYGLPFFLLPAVAPDALVTLETPRETQVREPHRTPRGALLGSFWDQSWFDRLCEALETSGYAIDWFGNHRSPWLEFSARKLESARIQTLGVVPEERLAAELRRYPFVIVPAGSLEAGESNRSVASLSLPGRIIFAAATSQTPILVVGSERTCAARFVKHFGIGETVPYDGAALKAAMDRLSSAPVQQEMRRRAARIGPAFSDRGAVEWLERSVELGRAADMRFEDVFARYCIEP
jgi:hypothetical protein